MKHERVLRGILAEAQRRAGLEVQLDAALQMDRAGEVIARRDDDASAACPVTGVDGFADGGAGIGADVGAAVSRRTSRSAKIAARRCAADAMRDQRDRAAPRPWDRPRSAHEVRERAATSTGAGARERCGPVRAG